MIVKLAVLPDVELRNDVLCVGGKFVAQIHPKQLMNLRDYLIQFCKPRLYKLDPHGYITDEEWKGQDKFLEDHPLPSGAEWQHRKCGYNGQIRLHRSDADPDIDVYGLEFVYPEELDKIRLIKD